MFSRSKPLDIMNIHDVWASQAARSVSRPSSLATEHASDLDHTYRGGGDVFLLYRWGTLQLYSVVLSRCQHIFRSGLRCPIACGYSPRTCLCYRRTDNIARATECFQRSVQLNPFLWSAFESLCLIGDYSILSLISSHCYKWVSFNG